MMTKEFEPDEFLLCLLRPELFRRIDGLEVKPAILRRRFDVGLPREIFRRRKNALFMKDGSDGSRLVVFAHKT